MSKFLAAWAVAAPAAATRGRGGCTGRRVLTSHPRRNKKRTAFWLVKSSQSKSVNRRSAESRSSEFSGGAKSIVGRRRIPAPSASSASDQSWDCSGPRVSTMIFPASGWLCFSNGPSCELQKAISAAAEKLGCDFPAQRLGVRTCSAHFFPTAANTFRAIRRKNASIKNHFAGLNPRPSAERQAAAALHFGEQGAFSCYREHGVVMRKARNTQRFIFARLEKLDAQRALTHGRQDHLRRQNLGDTRSVS